MKIVIDIPEEKYKWLKENIPKADKKSIVGVIVYGTPLPKGHGRLIDADKTIASAWANFYAHEDEWQKKDKDYVPFGRFYDQNGFECCQQVIVNAPTIIEADKDGDEG